MKNYYKKLLTKKMSKIFIWSSVCFLVIICLIFIIFSFAYKSKDNRYILDSNKFTIQTDSPTINGEDFAVSLHTKDAYKTDFNHIIGTIGTFKINPGVYKPRFARGQVRPDGFPDISNTYLNIKNSKYNFLPFSIYINTSNNKLKWDSTIDDSRNKVYNYIYDPNIYITNLGNITSNISGASSANINFSIPTITFTKIPKKNSSNYFYLNISFRIAFFTFNVSNPQSNDVYIDWTAENNILLTPLTINFNQGINFSFY